MMLVAILLGIGILICLVRVMRGPSIPDRVVAMEVINTLVVAVLAVMGTAFEEVIYIDVAIVYALLSFVSVLWLARFVEGGK